MSDFRVAVMQPTYLPWLGYFSMIDNVDLFVFLDNVQFSRRSWQQRNRILLGESEHFLSIPVRTKGQRDQLIVDAELEFESGFAPKHWRSIESGYAKMPFFSGQSAQLKEKILHPPLLLADFTIGLIRLLTQVLGITTHCVRSSQLGATGAKGDLIAQIVEEVGGSHYVAAPGSRAYIEDSRTFSDRGLEVEYFNFAHPVYRQGNGEFRSHLSVLDALFRVGPDECLALARSGVGSELTQRWPLGKSLGRGFAS